MSSLTFKEELLRDFAESVIRDLHKTQEVSFEIEDIVFDLCDAIEYTHPEIRDEAMERMEIIHKKLDAINKQSVTSLKDLTGVGD